MAGFMKQFDRLRRTTAGRVVEAVIYAAMLTLVMIYFTGNGQFLYEI